MKVQVSRTKMSQLSKQEKNGTLYLIEFKDIYYGHSLYHSSSQSYL